MTRRCRLSFAGALVLRRFPERVEFFERAIFESPATRVYGALDLLETFDEFFYGAVEQIFGMKFLKAGEVDDGEACSACACALE